MLIVLISLASASFPALAQASPDDVAKALLAAQDSNNFEAAIALFAPDAVVTLPTGVMNTPEQIRVWQQDLAEGHFRLESGKHEIEGNVVRWDGSVSLDRFRDLGVASLDSTSKLVVEGGKIKTFDFTFTPEAFTELQAGTTAAALIAAEAAHDVDGAVALFADDAVVTLPTGVHDTLTEIRVWQQEIADGHMTIEPEGRTVSGNTVSWTGEVSYDPFRALGIASMGSLWKLVMENGKIKTFDFTFTPEAFTELQAGATAYAFITEESVHDVDAVMALFADNAVVTLPKGVLDTPETIRAWQQELADGHFRLESEGRHVVGNTVSWVGEVSYDSFRSMGILSLDATWDLVIDNGKITTFTFNFTPEAMQTLMATPEAK